MGDYHLDQRVQTKMLMKNKELKFIIMENSILLKKNIFWKEHPRHKRYYYIEDGDKIILLRLNNFPEEPLWTIINGLDIMDIEDRPSGWILENIDKE